MGPHPARGQNPIEFFYRISDAIFNDCLLLFAAAQPSISLLFTTLSWGSAFFVESGKYQKILKNSSQHGLKIHTKSHQKSMKKQHPKIYRKITKNHPKITQKMGPIISRNFPEAAPIATQKATRPPRTAQRAPLGPTKAP